MPRDRRAALAGLSVVIWLAALVGLALSDLGVEARHAIGISLLGAATVAVGVAVLFVARRYHRASMQALRRQAELLSEVRSQQDRLAERIEGEIARQGARMEALTALHHRLDVEDELPMLRGFVAAPDVLTLLYDRVRAERPELVVECGSGASTVVMARALARNGAGRLVALEHVEHHADVTRGLVDRAGLSHLVDVVSAPLVSHHLPDHDLPWYDLERAGPLSDIGLLFVDGPPAAVGQGSRYPALPLLAGALRPGALVVVDDAARPDEAAIIERWCEELPLDVEVSPAEGLERGSAVLRFSQR